MTAYAIPALIAGLPFLGGAFANWSFDPTTWEPGSRFLVAVFTAIIVGGLILTRR